MFVLLLESTIAETSANHTQHAQHAQWALPTTLEKKGGKKHGNSGSVEHVRSWHEKVLSISSHIPDRPWSIARCSACWPMGRQAAQLRSGPGRSVLINQAAQLCCQYRSSAQLTSVKLHQASG